MVSPAEDLHADFVNEDHMASFARALALEEDDTNSTIHGPCNSASLYVSSHNDWTPIYSKTAPAMKDDDVSWSFNLLWLPLLLGTLFWTFFLSLAYFLIRIIVTFSEFVTLASDRQRNKLVKQLKNSKNYKEYVTNAQLLDSYLGLDEWKHDDRYKYYDYKTIRRSMNKMMKYRMSNRVEDLMVLLQSCIKSNFGGIENPLLYSHTYFGTKTLINQYNEEVVKCINFISESNSISSKEKRIFFKILDKNFGRTCLVLSGGASFCLNHLGVLKALIENDLMPEIISGTSGGGMIAALAATRTNEELLKLIKPELYEQITPFGKETFWEGFRRWWETGARFDSLEWARQGQWWTMGSTTFKEILLRTGKVLNISTVPHDIHSPTILCNFITSPNCCVWSSMIASAAVPGILNPVVLMEKTKDDSIKPFSLGSKWKDGSLRTDIPLSTLNVYFNTKFSIVSQVNPHVMLWIFKNRGDIGKPIMRSKGLKSKTFRGGFILSYLENLIKLEIIKWLKLIKEFQLFPNLLQSDWSNLFLQKFDGTITLFPKIQISDYLYILSNPTKERLDTIIKNGEHITWPKLEFIKHRLNVERAIRSGLEKSLISKSSASSASPSPSRESNSKVKSLLVQSLKRKRKSARPHPNDLEELIENSENDDSDDSDFPNDVVSDSNFTLFGIKDDKLGFTSDLDTDNQLVDGGNDEDDDNSAELHSSDLSDGSH